MSKLNTEMYTAIWQDTNITEAVREWADNSSDWAYGATDPDLCCGDGNAPSFLLNTLSQQGAPHNYTGPRYNMNRFVTKNLTLNDWLRSFFP